MKNPNLWFEKSESPVNLIERERLEERRGRGREKIAGRRERKRVDVMCKDMTRVLFFTEEPKDRTQLSRHVDDFSFV